jgi:hypothetical protein
LEASEFSGWLWQLVTAVHDKGYALTLFHSGLKLTPNHCIVYRRLEGGQLVFFIFIRKLMLYLKECRKVGGDPGFKISLFCWFHSTVFHKNSTFSTSNSFWLGGQLQPFVGIELVN